jgi:hypothetical protein
MYERPREWEREPQRRTYARRRDGPGYRRQENAPLPAPDAVAAPTGELTTWDNLEAASDTLADEIVMQAVELRREFDAKLAEIERRHAADIACLEGMVTVLRQYMVQGKSGDVITLPSSRKAASG